MQYNRDLRTESMEKVNQVKHEVKCPHAMQKKADEERERREEVKRMRRAEKVRRQKKAMTNRSMKLGMSTVPLFEIGPNRILICQQAPQEQG
jgi:hypothetical protein